MAKINLKLFIFLILAASVIGCSKEAKKSEDQYLNEAKTQFDEKKYDESIKTYREFIKEYPKSDKAIFAYNQIAGIQIDLQKNPQEGIKTYKELAEKFPSTKESKQAMFMVAFIYDETLKDKDNAIKSYQEFLAKYPTDSDPNDKMSESAKTMLEVLQSGKSIEQMIQENIQKSGNQQGVDTSKVKVIEEKAPAVKEQIKKEDPRVPANKENTGTKPNEDPALDKKKESE
ncbi:MAG: tetratricopeptide repeat protein [Ignavibacteria bacterium]|nr:tetratricopeptide repeat protein [Ignavibacteria bacterium]